MKNKGIFLIYQMRQTKNSTSGLFKTSWLFISLDHGLSVLGNCNQDAFKNLDTGIIIRQGITKSTISMVHVTSNYTNLLSEENKYMVAYFLFIWVFGDNLKRPLPKFFKMDRSLLVCRLINTIHYAIPNLIRLVRIKNVYI